VNTVQSYQRKDLGVARPVNVEEIPWVEFDLEFGHSQSKLIRVCVRENWFISRIRWSAGIKIPTHRHFGPVHVVTHSGRWHYKEYDWYATAGSHVYETPETEHSLVVDEDIDITVTTFGAFVDIGPNGELYRYYDAQVVLDIYAQMLAATGRKVPPDIIVG